MRRHLALLAALAAALTLAGQASALDVGITGDEGTASPDWFYGTLQAVGMKTNVMTLRWNPLDPEGLPPNFEEVRAAAGVAERHGVELVLAVYQTTPTGITDTPDAPAVFARWLQNVVRSCPLCARKVIVLNEPNQPRFFQPIFDGSCRPSSPAVYADVLAAAYDGLKAVDASVRVYGLGLSPRGNDKCAAADNVSLSPVTFLLELGKAYRASRRSKPLMDGLSFHAYHVSGEPPHVGQKSELNVGIPDLRRLKQAFSDAFRGTAQPLIGIQSAGAAGPPATIAIDELGWQVGTEALPGYFGRENVATVTETQHAEWSADVIARFACDPSVERLSFLHLRDEPDRDRWQSGLIRLDYSSRPALGAVKQAIAENGSCRGARVSWKPTTTVIGAKTQMPPPRTLTRKQTVVWGPTVRSDEKASVVAEIRRVRSGAGRVKGRKFAAAKAVRSARFQARPGFPNRVRFKGRLGPGRYAFSVRYSASANTSRTAAFTSRPFRVK